MTPKNWTQKVHYSCKPIIWSYDLLPQVGHRILAHLQSFLCVLYLMTHKKESVGHQLGPMIHFLTSSKFDLLSYIGEKCLHTHLQSFLCMPYLMTPKKCSGKRCMLPFPNDLKHFQICPTFDLAEIGNRAKCGLQLNDPID